MLCRRSFIAGTLTLSAGSALAQEASTAAALRALAEGGAIALIRHAAAPGTGDPPGFQLGDCATQRYLSEAGRRQAAELGRKLREVGVQVAEARSSRWCRALDTARLAFPDVAVEPDPALDSLFGEAGRRTSQTEQARALVLSWRGRKGTLALVTHQVNITALTGVYPAEGEIIVLRPGTSDAELLGRVRP